MTAKKKVLTKKVSPSKQPEQVEVAKELHVTFVIKGSILLDPDGGNGHIHETFESVLDTLRQYGEAELEATVPEHTFRQ